MTTSRIITGDCLGVMATLPADSVHAIVTDPPYGLEFMGRAWDRLWDSRPYGGTPGSYIGKDGAKRQHGRGRPGPTYQAGKAAQRWHGAWAREALRVAKPGAFLLAFGGTRTFHRLTCAIEDAGWEIRDCVLWLYGSGFPKSLDVSKAIDKAAKGYPQGGPNPNSTGHGKYKSSEDPSNPTGRGMGAGPGQFMREQAKGRAAEVTDARAKEWQGWGTALKPAWEPVIVARKPLDGTVANNVLKHGCGGLNVDACRVGASKDDLALMESRSHPHGTKGGNAGGAVLMQFDKPDGFTAHAAGRWPANVVHDGSDEVLAGFPRTTSGKCPDGYTGKYKAEIYGKYARNQIDPATVYGDSGSAARFFFCAKASKRERNAGCGGLPKRGRGLGFKRCMKCGKQKVNMPGSACECVEPEWQDVEKFAPAQNNHPTVKPLALMQWLVTLVTPLGGIVLDPFMGSGTTGIACGMLGFNFIGIEKDPQYVEIARARIREHCGLLVDLN